MTPKAVNGHVIYANIECPADKVVSGIELHTRGCPSTAYGVVMAIDEELTKHICEVGDIIYVGKQFIVGELEVDGGDIWMIVREGTIGGVVNDVEAKRKFFNPGVVQEEKPKIITPPKLVITQ